VRLPQEPKPTNDSSAECKGFGSRIASVKPTTQLSHFEDLLGANQYCVLRSCCSLSIFPPPSSLKKGISGTTPHPRRSSASATPEGQKKRGATPGNTGQGWRGERAQATVRQASSKHAFTSRQYRINNKIPHQKDKAGENRTQSSTYRAGTSRQDAERIQETTHAKAADIRGVVPDWSLQAAVRSKLRTLRQTSFLLGSVGMIVVSSLTPLPPSHNPVQRSFAICPLRCLSCTETLLLCSRSSGCCRASSLTATLQTGTPFSCVVRILVRTLKSTSPSHSIIRVGSGNS
jgi:hypothetical protein